MPLYAKGAADLGIVWRSIMSQSIRLPTGTAARYNLFAANATAINLGTPPATTSVVTNIPQLYLDDADYAQTGVTIKLRVVLIVECNDTAPGGDFTLSLNPVTAAGGTGAGVARTVGAAVGNAAVVTAPSANTQNRANSTEFTIPADGYYVPVVRNHAAVATNAEPHVTALLHMRHVAA